MIPNLIKCGHIYSTIRYAAFKDGATLLDTNMGGSNPAQLAAEFEYFSNKNQRTQRPVFHLSINPHPDDRPLTESEYRDIAADIRQELGFDDNKHQYVLALHTDALLKDSDKIRPHLHLVVNRVDFNGKCKKDYLDYINVQKACRKVEAKHGLIIQPNSWEIEEKKGSPSRESETKFIQEAIKQAAIDKPEMPTFISRLQTQNISVQCRITRTGKLQGISYSYNNKSFKGRQIGNNYSHIGIQEKLGVVHKQSHKHEIELLINNYKPDTNDSSDNNYSDNQSQIITQNNNDYVSVLPSIKELFPLQPQSKDKQDSIDTHKGNTNTNDVPENDDYQDVVAPQNNDNYISTLPPLSELFPPPKNDKSKKAVINNNDNNAPTPINNEIETQSSITPEAQVTPPIIESSTTPPIDNNKAVECLQIVNRYMANANSFEIKGETLHAYLDTDTFQLTVERINDNTIVLQGNQLDGEWRPNIDNLTDGEIERIKKLEQGTIKREQQRDNGIEM